MLLFLLNRLYQSIYVILGVTLVVFLILHIAGDPVQLFLPPGATTEMIEEYRQALGLNDPIYIQYFNFIKGIAVGDFGKSFYYNESAMHLVMERFPATLELTAASVVMTIIVGFPAGIISAVMRNSKTDFAIRMMALIGQCVPVFWIALLLIIVFSVKLHILPTSGRGTLLHLIMPAFALGLYSAASTARLLRSSMLEVLSKDYILVARAKGLSKKVVILKHTLKNAVSAVMTVLGMHIAGLLGGAVITETVFAWPGIGRLAIQSINNRDFAVVEAVVILIAVSYVAINLLVDICYAIINPRIKLTRGG